jgi:hypothetical protein
MTAVITPQQHQRGLLFLLLFFLLCLLVLLLLLLLLLEAAVVMVLASTTPRVNAQRMVLYMGCWAHFPLMVRAWESRHQPLAAWQQQQLLLQVMQELWTARYSCGHRQQQRQKQRQQHQQQQQQQSVLVRFGMLLQCWLSGGGTTCTLILQSPLGASGWQ